MSKKTSILQQILNCLRKKKGRESKIRRRNFASPDDLTFHRLGGAGTIKCLECDFSQKIISFTHGAMSCRIGRQCQQCGTFFAEYNKGEKYHRMGPRMKPVLCPHCQKEYTDEETYNTYPLFCPKCKTKNLSYHLEYIT